MNAYSSWHEERKLINDVRHLINFQVLNLKTEPAMRANPASHELYRNTAGNSEVQWVLPAFFWIRTVYLCLLLDGRCILVLILNPLSDISLTIGESKIHHHFPACCPSFRVGKGRFPPFRRKSGAFVYFPIWNRYISRYPMQFRPTTGASHVKQSISGLAMC